jgi:predicted DNA-binding protein (MmcQ/YjbR family)
MDKKHWNTVVIDGSVADNLLQEWINDSYNLVLNKIKKK